MRKNLSRKSPKVEKRARGIDTEKGGSFFDTRFAKKMSNHIRFEYSQNLEKKNPPFDSV
jgi:hypothetical protein